MNITVKQKQTHEKRHVPAFSLIKMIKLRFLKRRSREYMYRFLLNKAWAAAICIIAELDFHAHAHFIYTNSNNVPATIKPSPAAAFLESFS